MRRIGVTLAVVLIAVPGQLVSQATGSSDQRLPHEPADGPEVVAGVYAFVPDASDDVEEAIDEAVADMNFITRRIARGRLRSTNEIPERITITVAGDDVAIQQDERTPVEAPADGVPVDWISEDGEALEVSVTWDAPVLGQTFVAEDGQRMNTFELDEDGQTLTMRVTVSSPRLPNDLTYRLVYERTR